MWQIASCVGPFFDLEKILSGGKKDHKDEVCP